MRKSGVAFDHEEHTLGICAAGVVMRDLLGNDIAISVPVPAQRFDQQQRIIAARCSPPRTALEQHLVRPRRDSRAAAWRTYRDSIQTYHMMGQAADAAAR